MASQSVHEDEQEEGLSMIVAYASEIRKKVSQDKAEEPVLDVERDHIRGRTWTLSQEHITGMLETQH